MRAVLSDCSSGKNFTSRRQASSAALTLVEALNVKPLRVLRVFSIFIRLSVCFFTVTRYSSCCFSSPLFRVVISVRRARADSEKYSPSLSSTPIRPIRFLMTALSYSALTRLICSAFSRESPVQNGQQPSDSAENFSYPRVCHSIHSTLLLLWMYGL